VLETEKIARVPRAQNSDTLASQGPGAYSTRWALINQAGQIEQQTGGFSLVDCFRTNANCYVNANEDVTNNGVHTEIAATNTAGFGADDITGQTGTGSVWPGVRQLCPSRHRERQHDRRRPARQRRDGQGRQLPVLRLRHGLVGDSVSTAASQHRAGRPFAGAPSASFAQRL